MDKTIAAFVVILAILIGVLLFIGFSIIDPEVGIPIITTALGAAIMYLFPAKNSTS